MKTTLRFVLGLLVIAAAVFGISKFDVLMGGQANSAEEQAIYEVQRRTVDDRVVERGTVESQNTVHGRCELPGWSNKIIKIVDEGTFVKEGEIVAELEAEEIDQEIAQKKVELNEARGLLEQSGKEIDIQKNKGESDIAEAELNWELAKLDLEKYRDGDSVAQIADQERAIKEAQAELEKIRDERKNTELLVKKGYRSPEQLRESELREQSLGFRVESEIQRLKVLNDFDYKRQITEFEAKAKNFERALARAITTAKAEELKAQAAYDNAQNAVQLHEAELKELEDIKGKCVLKAPQDGTVAYANQPWFDPEDRIREGTTVRQQQDIFYLPDMENMQVRVNVHESVVNRIKVDQIATIRLDAFPDVNLQGKVTFVSELAASSYSDTKNYEALVVIDEIPESLELKPGMTAEVNILVGTYADIIAVPVGAITEHFQQTYAYIFENGKAVRRKIETGRVTHSFVEVTEGLNPGEAVALDAYQRGNEDFAEAERAASADSAPMEAAAGKPAS